MRNLKLALAVASLLAFACPALAQNEFATPTSGKTVVGFQVMCQNGSNQAVPCSSAVPLQIGGTFSATLGGFTPSLSNARGTPITVTTSDSSGTLPTGTVVDVSNVGSNPMYCNVNGVAATAADKLIASNSWFEFTIPAGGTALHCIATGGSTTANMVGGAGLGTGAGGGSSGGGGGGNVNLTQILGATPSATNPLWVSPASGATFPVSGTFWQATQPVSIASMPSTPVTGTFFQATQPVSASALPLPTGAATSANQSTEITSLGTIATNSGTQATAANQATIITDLGTLHSDNTATLAAINAPIAAGSATIGSTYPLPYPLNAVPITASAAGTTAATTATLPASTTGKTTYICSYSIRANATANANVQNTITGIISGTRTDQMWVPANTAGLGVDEQIFTPCIPASAANTAIAVVSGAPGTGGNVTVNAAGFQL